MSYVLSSFRRKTREIIFTKKQDLDSAVYGVPRESPQGVKFFSLLASTENMKPQPSQHILISFSD